MHGVFFLFWGSFHRSHQTTHKQWHNHMHLKLAHGWILKYISRVFSIRNKFRSVHEFIFASLIDINVLLIDRISRNKCMGNGHKQQQKVPARTKRLNNFLSALAPQLDRPIVIYNFNFDDQFSIISVRKFLKCGALVRIFFHSAIQIQALFRESRWMFSMCNREWMNEINVVLRWLRCVHLLFLFCFNLTEWTPSERDE